jgi:ammonium transporter, Amt family
VNASSKSPRLLKARVATALVIGVVFGGLAFATDPSGTLTGTVKDLPLAKPGEPTLAELGALLGQGRIAINIIWTMIAAFLVMFMQAGFALAETGFTRAKNAGHTMVMNFLIYGIGILGFLMVGFAFQMGGSGGSSALGGGANLSQMLGVTIGDQFFGLLGFSGFGLSGNAYDVPTFALFFFHLVFMDTALTIPTGAMAERWKLSAFVVYGFVASMLIYPVFASWAWGGGWLSTLGKNFGLGHGYVDFAGSGVVHLTGGVMALMGVIVLGPRIGKYGRDGSVRSIPGHNQPMAMLGVFILAFGWFGFNAGSTLAGTDLRLVTVAVSAMVTSAAAMLSAALFSTALLGKLDLGHTANGLLAGLVATTASGAFIGAPASVLLGAIAGILYVSAAIFIEHKLKLDDPVSAIAVHGVSGLWGVLSVGILADGTYGNGLNGVTGGVTGLLYGGYGQFLAQVIGIVANLAWVGLSSYAMFRAIDATIGMRVKPHQEIEGLDYHQIATPAYSYPALEGDAGVNEIGRELVKR